MPIRRLLLVLVAFVPLGKRFLYVRAFGAKIGRDVKLGFGAILLFERLALEDGVRIGPATIIDAVEVAIGTRSRIGALVAMTAHSLHFAPSCTISSRVTVRGDRHDPRSQLTMGAECWIFDFCFLDATRPLVLGRNVGLGGGSYVFTHGYWLSQLHGYPVSYGAVTIEDDVWLPWDCFVMPGVRIGRGSVIGARSLITKDVPPGALAAGSPAKVIRDQVAKVVTPAERAGMLLANFAEFAAARGEQVVRRDELGWAIAGMAGSDVIAVALDERSDSGSSLPDGVLRLIHKPLGARVRDADAAWFSTETFQGSPRRALSRIQHAWLQSMRGIGTRYYPIDEVEVETGND